jgi:hypothetical protein
MIEPNSEESLNEILHYLASLPDKERVAYDIAKEHLGTSFTVEKTVGFLRWKRQRMESDIKQ